MLGSGGLTIGQAGEFDYSGSQAIKVSSAGLVLSLKSFWLDRSVGGLVGWFVRLLACWLGRFCSY